METNRDDFVIAVRSAFIRKNNQQKFSLLALIIASFVLLSLEAVNSKTINFFRSAIKDIIYRSTFIVHAPSNIINNTSNYITDHYNLHTENELLKSEIKKIKNIDNEISYLKTENLKLKKAIGLNQKINGKNIISKVLVDKKSPYLKSVILNKGINSGFKKGMPVLDGLYLIGRITEVNYLSARVLLISDLNSKIPVIIEPEGYQAIMAGTGDNKALLDYLPTKNQVENGNVVYTSGSDGIFNRGIPIGKIQKVDDTDKIFVKFFSELNQLYFVKVIVSSEDVKLGR